MVENNSITFTVWQDDPPLEIQLEPEATSIVAKPNEDITFTVINPVGSFSWSVRYDTTGIQLFPETRGGYERIVLYRNSKPTKELDFLF